MSNKDKAKQIIDKLPDYKVAKILLFLQGFELSDEIEDDFICERIYQEYLNDPNKDKEETYTLANCKNVFHCVKKEGEKIY